MIIEEALISDIKQLCELRELQQKEKGNTDLENDNTADFLLNHLNTDLTIYVAKVKSKIVSACGISIINKEKIKIGHIYNMFTVKEYRQKGIQIQLLQQCINFAKTNNLVDIQLN